MPIYEFKCSNCSTIHEYLLGINEDYPTKCESCQIGKISKIMSSTNFVLKGQGWYETDFKNKKSKSDDKGASSTQNTNKSDAKKTKDSASASKEKKSEPTKDSSSENSVKKQQKTKQA